MCRGKIDKGMEMIGCFCQDWHKNQFGREQSLKDCGAQNKFSQWQLNSKDKSEMSGHKL